MADETQLDRIIADLYDAVLSDQARPSLPLALAQLVNAPAGSVWNLDIGTGAVSDYGLNSTTQPDEYAKHYIERFHRHDPWAVPQGLVGSMDVVLSGELLDERVYERSLFYNEFGRYFGVFHAIGAVVPIGDGRCAAMSLLRPRNAERFGEAERERLRRVVPHLQRAFQMRARLIAGQERAAAAEVGLDALSTAVIVTTGQALVLYANPAAIRLDGAGLVRLGRTGEALSAPSAGHTTRLLALIANAARGGTGGVAGLVAKSGASAAAHVSPAPRSRRSFWPAGADCALIVLRPVPGTNPADHQRRARDMFGMTPAEAEVTALLVSGIAPAEIAARRAVRLTTIRTLLRRAMEKTDAANLRDLTRVFACIG